MAKHVYGTMPTTMPEGFAKRIHFPNMANLNLVTGDHRRLEATGGGARGQAPWTIRTQPSASIGHDGAIPSGALFQITIDEEAEIITGDGFLLDDEWGQKTAYWIATGAQEKNSVDLADVSARFVEDMDTGDYWIDFVKWNIAATTIVATPAFADARAEIVAALHDTIYADPMEPLVVSAPSTFNIVGAPEIEVTADGSTKPPYEHFFRPEADVPTKIIVDENLCVYGHLSIWESCHDGKEGACLMTPRPTDSYTSFNKPGVLTDRGMVQTGPIFAFGGHRRAASAPTIEQAYGGIENAWADVRVIEGKHGPWLSGRVRPGVDADTVYAARASRISGHWVGGRLKAIVSVNSEGFDVPGTASDAELDLVAGFHFSLSDEGVTELVASFPTCLDQAHTSVEDDTPALLAMLAKVNNDAEDDLLLQMLMEESD